MDEYLDQMNLYLPINFLDPDNEEFITSLQKSYLINVHNDLFCMAFISFHMLYMTFGFKTAWFLKKCNYNHIGNHISSCSRELPAVLNDMFDFCNIDEAKFFNILRCLRFNSNQIDILSRTVKTRNHCAHASGKIEYSNKEIEQAIKESLENVAKTHAKTTDCLLAEFKTFIYENFDPETRQYSDASSTIDEYIRLNSYSIKDIEYMMKLDLPEILGDGKSKTSLLKIILYLSFVSKGSDFSGEYHLLEKKMNKYFDNLYNLNRKVRVTFDDDLIPLASDYLKRRGYKVDKFT